MVNHHLMKIFTSRTTEHVNALKEQS